MEKHYLEAYVKTDFSKIDDELFKGVIRKYSLYKYMDSKASLDRKNSEKIYWLLDNYNEFEKLYAATKIVKKFVCLIGNGSCLK